MNAINLFTESSFLPSCKVCYRYSSNERIPVEKDLTDWQRQTISRIDSKFTRTTKRSFGNIIIQEVIPNNSQGN